MDPHSFSKLDPEPDPHSLKKLDPDPEPDPHKVNADPNHCVAVKFSSKGLCQNHI
jgi:hypothetical protein